MNESTTAHVFHVGEQVKFEGQPAVIVKASAPKRDLFGVESQSIAVSRYEGKMTTLIGSNHSQLEVLA